MRFSLELLSGFAVLGALSGSADDVFPPHFNFDRYARILDHSPFAIATAVALSEVTPDFAKDLYVANAAHSLEGDMVTIASSAKKDFKRYLTTSGTIDGYGIVSIEWSDRVGATRVTISKDGNFATLMFNQSLLSQSASAGRSLPDQVPSILPQVADEISHVRAREVIEQNRKPVAAPSPNVKSSPVPNPDPPGLLDLGPPVSPDLDGPNRLNPIGAVSQEQHALQ